MMTRHLWNVAERQGWFRDAHFDGLVSIRYVWLYHMVRIELMFQSQKASTAYISRGETREEELQGNGAASQGVGLCAGYLESRGSYEDHLESRSVHHVQMVSLASDAQKWS
jgi:hypothetical protein